MHQIPVDAVVLPNIGVKEVVPVVAEGFEPKPNCGAEEVAGTKTKQKKIVTMINTLHKIQI